MFAWNKYPLLRILIPFVAGIIIAFYTDFVFPVWILLTVTVIGFVFVQILHKYRTYKNRWVSGLLIVVSIFSFSLSYTQLFINQGKPSLALIGKDKQLFTASVIESPTVKPKTVKLIVRIEKYKQGESFQDEHSKAIIYVARNEQAENIAYGDKLLFYTYLNEPTEPKNPNEFNYKRYLSTKNIHIQSYADTNSWRKISEKNGNPILHFATNARAKFVKIFKDCNMDVQEYGVISAILLGDSDELDPDLVRSYSAAGASHILCVSGMHVGIIYMIIFFFLRFLDKTKQQRIIRSFILLGTVWLYACITGLTPSLMRSATMLSFVAIGGLLNRKTNSYNSLLVSMIFLLTFNPLMIFYVGFQFSYLAVFGIVWANQHVSSLYTARTKAGKHVWGIMSVSIVAQMFTCPLAILYFHQFPNYFLLTNIIVITLTPFIIGFGIAVLALSFWGFAYHYLSLALTYLIKSMNWAIVKIEALPYSVTTDIDISFLQVIFCYLLILLLLSAFFYKKKSYLFQGLACLFIVMGMDLYKQTQIGSQKEIVFYSTRTGYAIDCIDGLNANLICDDSLANDWQTYNYNIKNNHVSHRIRNINKFQNKKFVSFNGKTIFVLSKPFYANSLGHKIKVDYLLLTNNKNYSIKLIKNTFETELLLLDGSFSFYRTEQIKNACKEEKLAFHDLKNNGAVIITF